MVNMRNILAALVALAGLGALVAPAAAQQFNNQTGATYTVAPADCDPNGRRMLTVTNAASVAIALPQPGLAAGTQNFINCQVNILNLGGLPAIVTATSATIDGALTIQVPNNSIGLTLVTDGNLWHKSNYAGLVFGANILDNGDFQVDQQYEGTGAALASGTPARSLDRWWGTFTTSTSSAGNPTPTRASIATGLTLTARELKITMNATASTTQPAGLIGYVDQTIEGYNVADLQMGTTAALPQTYSGWMKVSVAGTYGIFLQNSGSAVSYVTGCTVAAATWTYCSGTIPGDPTGTWANTANTIGEIFGITWTCGSTFQAAAVNVWSTGAFNCVAAQTLLSATASATMELANWKLERGSTATPFQPDSNPVAMQKARHWYVKSFKPGTAVAQNAGTGTGETIAYTQIATSQVSAYVTFNPPLYHIASPTVTTYSPAAATAVCYDETGAAAVAGTPTTVVADTGLAYQCGATVATIAHAIGLHWTVDTGF
jgi:hypothetical protein